ncbi:MAG: S-adenosylhomocysteine hydrolase [halophilic archaeon J07HX5]|jgi:S-adenosylhomocysteine hydrolase|nr:MAG: S-adenosylhomocysteine hydrolase [halophilic archaeon J07HX5]
MAPSRVTSPETDSDLEDPLTWTRDHTPLLQSFGEEFSREQPFDGLTVAVASHLEPKTGVFIETLRAAGAEVLFAPSEPQSTHGDVVGFLDAQQGYKAFAHEGMTDEEFNAAQHALLERAPDVILDDGCELIAKAHDAHPEVARDVLAGAEQTTAGITRLEAMDREDVLEFPVYGVNDTPMKHYFDNVHGTGESALANIMISTNAMVAGTTAVVAGYGYVGRGVAEKLRSLGADTIVTEVDPRRALQARMSGHRITDMTTAAAEGELFITATGSRAVIREEHFDRMQTGTKLANAGHFDVEIVVEDLERMAERTTDPTPGVTRYHLPDGRHLDLLADGRLVNLTGPYSQGHAAEVIDMTFAMMFMAAYDLVGRAERPPGLYTVPDRVDRQVAERKLETLGDEIDVVSERQAEYQADWRHGDQF